MLNIGKDDAFTRVATRPEGAPRDADSVVLVEDVLLWGAGGSGGRVAAIGAGGAEGADADGVDTGVATDRDGGGGGGVAPNRLKPFAERFAAAAATLPKPGFGRSSAGGPEETSAFCRSVEDPSSRRASLSNKRCGCSLMRNYCCWHCSIC